LPRRKGSTMDDETRQQIDWNEVAETLEMQLWRCVNGGEHQKASHVGAALQAIYLKRIADHYAPVDPKTSMPLSPKARAHQTPARDSVVDDRRG
jgi:hypothetical protein